MRHGLEGPLGESGCQAHVFCSSGGLPPPTSLSSDRSRAPNDIAHTLKHELSCVHHGYHAGSSPALNHPCTGQGWACVHAGWADHTGLRETAHTEKHGSETLHPSADVHHVG